MVAHCKIKCEDT